MELADWVEQRDVIAEGGPVKVIHGASLRGREYTSEGMDICFIWSVESVIVMSVLSGSAGPH